ncbi:hypothetical protein CPC16_001046 [Podila verticillata]|nr:hypothetical protein CPC16_001046 [Podila verticillata]
MGEAVLIQSTSEQDLYQRQQQSALIKDALLESGDVVGLDTVVSTNIQQVDGQSNATTIQATARIFGTENAEPNNVDQRHLPSSMTASPAQSPVIKASHSKEAIVLSTLPASSTVQIMRSASITARTSSLTSRQQKTKKEQQSIGVPTVNDTAISGQMTMLLIDEDQPHHHIQYSNKHSHRLHHHHHGHQPHWHNHSQVNHQRSSSNASHRSGQSEKKKKRRFSYSKVGVVISHSTADTPYSHNLHDTLTTHNTLTDPSGTKSHCDNKIINGSLGLLIDPTPKCCNLRVPSAGLKISPNRKISNEYTNDIGICAQVNEPGHQGARALHSKEHDHHYAHQYPCVRKMAEKHPAVKLEWKVPETIKAAGEFLRGVLIVSAKVLPETEMKKVAAKAASLYQQQQRQQQQQQDERRDTQWREGKHMKRKLKYDRLIRIEHVEVDLTGVEVLPIEDFKCIQDAASPSEPISPSISAALTVSSTSSSVSTAPTGSSISASSTAASVRDSAILRSPTSSTLVVPDSFQPGCVVPGTRQGITFQMQVPEKVGGVFKSAHASICYQLTANVHIRIGKELFALQHSMPVSLFELVQIRAATKIASPHDLSPTESSSNSVKRPSVRFVIPKANSVLGTTAVRPYSLWGLGPATSSHSSNHQYSNNHGYRKYHYGHNNHNNHSSHHRYHHTATSSVVASYAAQLLAESDQQQNGAAGDATLNVKRTRSQEDEIVRQEDQKQMARSKHNARQASLDGNIDEVGFGAHIDKSVAAAGDNVTLEMFVVKSDLMRVVDIKVSLVETINIYSLLDAHDSTGQPERKLVETHVVKIAKDYVPAQAEESHANDNHLKGYYEDHEDFRTAKSLFMYKLSMRIPETALTILDRELLKVDYMFVIKFFFKGRVGAFLELPIEIISQYNHNRISTISGAISCVTNSVQIALPPVPILIKRTESVLSDLNRLSVDPILRTSSADSSPGSVKDSCYCPGHSIDIATASSQFCKGASETGQVSDDGNQGSHKESILEPKTEVASEEDPTSEQIQATSEMSMKEVTACAEADPAPASSEVVSTGSNHINSDRRDELHVKKSPPKADLVPKIVVHRAYISSPDTSSGAAGQDTKTITTTVVTPALPLLFDLTSAVQPSPTVASTPPSSVSHAGSRRSSSSSELAPTVQSFYSRRNSISSQSTAPSVGFYEKSASPVAASNLTEIMDPVPSNINNGLVAKLAKSFSSSPLLRSRGSGTRLSPSPNGSSPNMTGLVSLQQQQSSAFTLAATTLSALTLISSVGQAVAPAPEPVAGNKAKRAHTFPHPRHPHQQQHSSPPSPLKSCLKNKQNAVPPGTNTMSAIQQSTNNRSHLGTKKVSFAKGSTPLPSPFGSQLLSTEVEMTSGLGNRAVGTPVMVGNNTSNQLTPMAAIQKVPIPLPQSGAFKIPSTPTVSSSSTALSPRSGRVLHPFDGHPNRLTTLDKQQLDHQILREQHRHGQLPKSSADPYTPGLQQKKQESVAVKELELQLEEEEVEVEVEEDNGCDESDEDEEEDEDDEQHETEEERIERRRLARVAWLAKYGDAFKQVYGAVPELPPI